MASSCNESRTRRITFETGLSQAAFGTYEIALSSTWIDVDRVKHAITSKRLLAGLGRAGPCQLRFVIAEEGITAAAYLVLIVAEGTWTIEDAGTAMRPARAGPSSSADCSETCRTSPRHSRLAANGLRATAGHRGVRTPVRERRDDRGCRSDRTAAALQDDVLCWRGDMP
jgi:hypothetical protein